MSGGFALMSAFAPDAFPDWVRVALFWLGVAMAAVGVCAALWHYRPRHFLADHVLWRFGKSKPTASTSASRKVEVLPRSRFDESKQSQFSYPYPKAVLKLRIQNPRGTRRGKEDGTPVAMALSAQLQNDHRSVLLNCSAILAGIEGYSGKDELLGKAFKLPKGGHVSHMTTNVCQFTMVKRDMSDEVSPEPFLLCLEGEMIPLEEDSTYVLAIELRSEYKFPTLAKVQIDTEKGLNAEARLLGHEVLTEGIGDA